MHNERDIAFPGWTHRLVRSITLLFQQPDSPLSITQEVPSKIFSRIRLQFSGRVRTVEQKFLNFEIIFFHCALSSFR